MHDTTLDAHAEEIVGALCDGAGYAGAAKRFGIAVTDLYAWMVADPERVKLCRAARECGFHELSIEALRNISAADNSRTLGIASAFAERTRQHLDADRELHKLLELRHHRQADTDGALLELLARCYALCGGA